MPVEKTPRGPVQPSPVPKLSARKALIQVALLIIGPAILMWALAQVWK